HRETFSAWFKSRARRGAGAGNASAASVPTGRVAGSHVSAAGVPTGRVSAAYKVALFHTCTVEYNDPATGRAAVRVLERNRADVSVPRQRCCGMPYLDGGAVDEAKALIRENVTSLAAAVREGRTIVVPGPTCSYMLKQEYPWLDGSDDAKLVARNTRDLFEYLAELRAEGRLDTSFTRSVGAVTYHTPCHLRAQNIGLKSAEILRLVEYERGRETRRREIIELKKPRRVSVGRYLTFVFENRETVWFQVQEMVRAERIVDDAKIAEEVEVYNALLPGPGELAAT